MSYRLLTIFFFSALFILTACFVLFFHRDFWTLIYTQSLEIFHNREEIRDALMEYGALAPLIFICLQILQIIFSPFPGEATGVLGGFLFGKWEGLLYSTIGLSIGSIAAFFISRQFRRLIQPWLARSPVYNRLEALLEHQGIFICFMLFLMPGFPKDFLCYFLGLSRIPWKIFFFIASAGRIPGTVMLSWQGAEIYNGNIVGLITLVVITIVVAGPAWIYREKIYLWIERNGLKE